MADRPIMRDRECLQCGVMPIAGYKYCSDGCFQKALYARRAAEPGFTERNRQNCRDWADRKFGKKPDGRKRRIRIEPHPCERCGKETRRPKFCSAYCSGRGEAGLRNRRIGNSRRRARLAAVKFEAFDPLEVLERDKWRCHLCGIPTPRRLRGTFEPNAPELDHIIPLAAGGDHSRKNTACACRRCNIMKSDRPLGQLRLIP